jgi:hypothetical protein
MLQGRGREHLETPKENRGEGDNTDDLYLYSWTLPGLKNTLILIVRPCEAQKVALNI